MSINRNVSPSLMMRVLVISQLGTKVVYKSVDLKFLKILWKRKIDPSALSQETRYPVRTMFPTSPLTADITMGSPGNTRLSIVASFGRRPWFVMYTAAET